MAYIPTYPESEYEMFGEDELDSKGDNKTELAVSQDTDLPQLYLVGQDNTAKPVSETLASFVTDAAREKLDPKFLEATIQKYKIDPSTAMASLFPKPMWKFGPSSRSYKGYLI